MLKSEKYGFTGSLDTVVDLKGPKLTLVEIENHGYGGVQRVSCPPG